MSYLFIVARFRFLYTDYQDVAIVYVCHRLRARSLCSANAPGHVEVYTRAPSLADERRRSMEDHLRYHGYDGVPGVVAKAGFNASSLATIVHRGRHIYRCKLSKVGELGEVCLHVVVVEINDV